MPAPAAQERLVRGILDERMAENERVLHHAAHNDELGGHELMQRSVESPVVKTGNLRKKATIEFPAYHRGNLRHLLGCRRQTIEPGHERALQTIRDLDVERYRLSALQDRASKLFYEQRHAVRSLRYPVGKLIRNISEHRFDQFAHLLLRQTPNGERRHLRQSGRPARGPFRSVRHNDKYSRAVHAAHNFFQHFTGRRIDPVRILNDKEQWRDLRREQ
jgi:hypothetical protein